MENTLIYYRPGSTDAEVLTEKQAKELIKVWGKKPYNHFDRLVVDQNYGTAFHEITEIMAFIQCDRVLNEKLEDLQKSIKEKPEAVHRNYYNKQQKTAFHLFSEAVKKFNKEYDEKIEEWRVPNKEILRVFGVPYLGVMNEVEESIKDIGSVPKPNKVRKINYTLEWDDQCTSYKTYYVKGKLTLKGRFVDFEFDDVNVGKIYQSYDKDYIQIYLYDYARSNRALQVVVDRLIKKGMLKLS